MVRRTVVRKNRYFDSVFLMQVARRIAAQPGISDASAILATDANRKALTNIGYGAGDVELTAAGPNDLVVAISGDEAAVEGAIANIDSFFAATSTRSGTEAEPHSIAEAVAERPQANIAVISVPGQYAAREARNAVENGLHVFLFSSNVAAEDEFAIKSEARRRGFLVMGPDCGTAYIGGAGVGFTNAVRRGPIGIVASTGTGMQEFATLVHRAGSGISNGIGIGSRDLSDAIGGISALMAIEALENDPASKVIAVLAKPPAAAVAGRIEERLSCCTKPVVLCLLGNDRKAGSENLRRAHTIDEAAALALQAVGIAPPASPPAFSEAAARELDRFAPEQRCVRGMFAGGTLCYQAQVIFRDAGVVVHSNQPLAGMATLANPDESRAHALIDMGAEFFVDGRPHPMIDPTLRRQRLEREGDDASVAVILLDFILGTIASRDPAGDLLPAIRRVQQSARKRRAHITIAASVCGTDEDGQNLGAQRRALEEAGVLVFPSAAQASAFAAEIARLVAPRKEIANAGTR